MARFRLRGTHRGAFIGIAPTGRSSDSVAIESIRMSIRMAGGKQVEHWAVDVLLGLMRQKCAFTLLLAPQ